jgi:hypothetical protein
MVRKMNKKIHLSMINLWCNKNLVDSQLFLWKLLSENGDGIEYYSDPYDKNVDVDTMRDTATRGLVRFDSDIIMNQIKSLIS